MRAAGRVAAAAGWLLVFGAPAAGQVPEAGTALVDRGCCLAEVRDGAKVVDVDVVGNDALSSSTIKNAIYTTESGGFLWFGDDHELVKAELVKDLQRLYVLYQRNGFFDAELVSWEVAPRDDGVAVRFEVSEGQPTRVDTLALEGFDYGERTEGQVRARLPLQQGEVFNEADLVASRELLENGFRDRGYPFATVLTEYRIRKDERTASITYTVDTGGVYYIGDIRIEGVEASDADLIRDQLVIETGQRYGRQRILDSQRRLYELGLYRLVDIAPQLETTRADTVDIRVSATPAPTRVVRFGVGYGTEDLIRARASWLDRNFFGRARQLELLGEYSRLDREASATYRQPQLVSPDLDLLVSGFLRFEVEPNYTVELLGARSRIGWRISRRLNADVGMTVERADFSDFDEGVFIPEFGSDFINPSRLLVAEMGVAYDGTDSLFSPSRGFRGSFRYELALPVASFDYAYHKWTLQVTHYREISEGWVVALKVLPGAIVTYSGDPDEGGEARVPLFERLFAGGSTSVRGYERRQLGPKDDPELAGEERDPEPIGGNGLLETSVELRFPISGKFRGAAFVDAGNVWDDANQISPGDIEYTPGAGLRYVTPVGPVRLDVARRMSNDEDERNLPRWVFHISIGNAF